MRHFVLNPQFRSLQTFHPNQVFFLQDHDIMVPTDGCASGFCVVPQICVEFPQSEKTTTRLVNWMAVKWEYLSLAIRHCQTRCSDQHHDFNRIPLGQEVGA